MAISMDEGKGEKGEREGSGMINLNLMIFSVDLVGKKNVRKNEYDLWFQITPILKKSLLTSSLTH